MNVAKAVSRGIEWLSTLFGFLAYGCVLIIVCVTFYEVIARYIFDSPTIWSLEITQYAQAVFVALAAAYVLKKEGHVSVSLVTERMSEKWRNRAICITSIVAAFLYGFMVYQMVKTGFFAFHIMKRSETLGLAVYPFQIVMAVGLGVFALQFLVRSYQYYLLSTRKN